MLCLYIDWSVCIYQIIVKNMCNAVSCGPKTWYKVIYQIAMVDIMLHLFHFTDSSKNFQLYAFQYSLFFVFIADLVSTLLSCYFDFIISGHL